MSTVVRPHARGEDTTDAVQGGSRLSLGQRVREDLRRRILAREWARGARLPSEADLTREYGVARVTVRTALKALESQGLVDIRHGSGTFVSDFGSEIRAGLQELRSITDTIREMGHEARMELHRKDVRRATPAECAKLGLEPDDLVVAVERAVLADEQAVAFSYDAIPLGLIPTALLEALGAGSVFSALQQHGIEPTRALAELHAVQDPAIGWGRRRPDDALYLLLDQVHYDRASRPLMYSLTYFIEGRFQFVILRAR